MILTREMKTDKAIERGDAAFNSIEIDEPENSFSGLWQVSVACLFNNQKVSPYFESEAEAELFHRQLVRLLKRHEWKESGQ